ncbi:MAG: hypothetical protein R2836_10785 [Chitinophagales bacterium]
MKDVFKAVEKYIPQTDEINATVSAKTVGWQLDHILNVVIVINEDIQQSNPSNYKAKFNYIKSLILLTGYIPRGKGKAPKTTRGAEEKYATDFLAEKLNKAKDAFNAIEKLPADFYFNHPLFGHMKRDTTKKFLKIHSKHHLKIIEDILK